MSWYNNYQQIINNAEKSAKIGNIIKTDDILIDDLIDFINRSPDVANKAECLSTLNKIWTQFTNGKVYFSSNTIPFSNSQIFSWPTTQDMIIEINNGEEVKGYVDIDTLVDKLEDIITHTKTWFEDSKLNESIQQTREIDESYIQLKMRHNEWEISEHNYFENEYEFHVLKKYFEQINQESNKYIWWTPQIDFILQFDKFKAEQSVKTSISKYHPYVNELLQDINVYEQLRNDLNSTKISSNLRAFWNIENWLD